MDPASVPFLKEIGQERMRFSRRFVNASRKPLFRPLVNDFNSDIIHGDLLRFDLVNAIHHVRSKLFMSLLQRDFDGG